MGSLLGLGKAKGRPSGPADIIEIVRADITSLHAEARLTPTPAKHHGRQAAAQAASSKT